MIGAVGGVSGVQGIAAAKEATAATDVAGATAGMDFAKGLDAVQAAGTEADQLATQVATGQLQDVHQFMAASTKASLAMELTVAVRDQAVSAYQEVMRMQV